MCPCTVKLSHKVPLSKTANLLSHRLTLWVAPTSYTHCGLVHLYIAYLSKNPFAFIAAHFRAFLILNQSIMRRSIN